MEQHLGEQRTSNRRVGKVQVDRGLQYQLETRRKEQAARNSCELLWAGLHGGRIGKLQVGAPARPDMRVIGGRSCPTLRVSYRWALLPDPTGELQVGAPAWRTSCGRQPDMVGAPAQWTGLRCGRVAKNHWCDEMLVQRVVGECRIAMSYGGTTWGGRLCLRASCSIRHGRGSP